MSDGFVLAQAVGGDVVWGEWNSAHTDFINFDHYFLSNGTRVELGVMCKCVTQNMTVTVQTEPTPEPPDPEPEPEPGVADMPYKIILGGGDSPYEETTLEGIVPKK
jgi:hypothetical protein